MNFPELNQGTQSWIDWPFPATSPFILFCLSPRMGVPFVTFKVGKAGSHLLALQHFFLSLTLTEILWSRLITIHGSSAGENSSCCFLQRCGDPLCLLLSGLSWGCHSLFVHPLATCLLGFQEKPPQVQFSLCTACLFQQNIQLLPAGRPPGS